MAGPDCVKPDGAPPAGTVLCRADELAPQQGRAFCFGTGPERFEMFLQRHGNAIVAYVNSCPHAGWPLDWRPGHFLGPSGNELLCANHGARFRIADGLCVAGPCRGARLVPVPINFDAGRIRLAERGSHRVRLAGRGERKTDR